METNQLEQQLSEISVRLARMEEKVDSLASLSSAQLDLQARMIRLEERRDSDGEALNRAFTRQRELEERIAELERSKSVSKWALGILGGVSVTAIVVVLKGAFGK